MAHADPSQHHTYHRSHTMKTLVVLSALMAVALAAPFLGEGSEDFKKIANNVPGTFKREKKSPLESSLQDNHTPGAPADQPTNLQTSHIPEFGVSGRSFGLKKPIIIKKKPLGHYQVYRDSDEEQQESGETCEKQVRVKFCNSKLENEMKNSNTEETKMTEEDMKHSIKLARKAVETLQHDLQIVEQEPSTHDLWNHGKSESDAELHQDIETTREALEHKHKNFGNLESMSLHAATLKEADGFDNGHFTMAKTEEQRLAQWKEAINAIQKNVEIARNIEESFKSTSRETEMLLADDSITNDKKNELNKGTEQLRTTKDTISKDDNKADSENCKIHANEKSSDNSNAEQALVDDVMTMSASSISENKVKDIHNSDTTRHASAPPPDTLIGEPIAVKKSLEHRDGHLSSMNLQDQKESIAKSVKSTENIKERKAETEKEIKTSADDLANIRAADNALIAHHMRPIIENNDKSEVKSAENFNEKFSSMNQKDNKLHKDLHTEQPKEVDTTMLRKSGEEVFVSRDSPVNTKTQKITTTENRFAQPGLKMANSEDLKKQSEVIAPLNNAGLEQFHEQKQSLLHPDIRAVNNFEKQQMKEPSQTRWAHDKNFQMQTGSLKSADGIHAKSMDHIHTMQHPSHHHHLTHNVNSHFDSTSHGLHHSRFPESFMAQGKAADVDMQSYYMAMRDGSKGPENQRFRWKPSHESLRSAYGAPAAPAAPSPSSSAVGVFPNANVGNCGIPLLLSCNPSVTAGSLAKAHPAPYSAPAYRTEDDFNFHTKRDVKKIPENLSTLNRSPNSNVKSSNVLVAKQ